MGCYFLFDYLSSQFTEKNSGSTSKMVKYLTCGTLPLRPTSIPGEPVLPVGRGLSCGKGIMITTIFRGKTKQNKKNHHDMREAGSSSCSSVALVLPSTHLQFSRWSCIITEVQTQRPLPTMRSLAYLYLSFQSGTLMHVDSKVNTWPRIWHKIKWQAGWWSLLERGGGHWNGIKWLHIEVAAQTWSMYSLSWRFLLFFQPWPSCFAGRGC